MGGMIAAIKGLVGEFMGAADGGLIVGGKRGKDSVPIMGMPGEYIMSVPEVEGVQKFMGAMGGSQRKSQEQQRAQTVNNQITIPQKPQPLSGPRPELLAVSIYLLLQAPPFMGSTQEQAFKHRQG